jgi:hypothetical protein
MCGRGRRLKRTVASIDAWLEALVARHSSAMTRPEFLKAIRALSARYVERRSALPDRSPLDSAGKRAAFAGFYAPLHFLTMRGVVRGLGAGSATLDTIVDLGCGTGVAGMAWASEWAPAPAIVGIDQSAWAIDEARRNWQDAGVKGRAERRDLVLELERLARASDDPRRRPAIGIVLGWSLNELTGPARDRAEQAIHALAARGAHVIVVEPIGRRLVPWWTALAERAVRAGARSDEWRFDDPLPPALASLDRDAGFQREELTARSLAWLPTASAAS